MAQLTAGKISERLVAILRCPVCGSTLADDAEPDDAGQGPGGGHYRCTNQACATAFPLVGGVPVLINEQRSLFAIADFVQGTATTFIPEGRFVRLVERIIPNSSCNLCAATNYVHFAALTRERATRPRVLVVGGSIVGEGMQALLAHHEIELVETDVSLGVRTAVICDGHDLPFADESFDGVIAQAVLEHVLDPYRCVAEMHRVLKPGGIIYAETPFMQQVHMGKYDFTRFTDLGHRRLFRAFDEVSSGIAGGPGMALAWSVEYFLLSFTRRKLSRIVARGIARMCTFWLKYFDYFLMKQPGAFDAASGYFFLGVKSEQTLSDRQLIRAYRGAIH